MSFDFVIGLSLVVVVVTTIGMGFAYKYVMQHIREDAAKAGHQ